jgi:Protein of unknown function (DUF1676)
MDRALTMDAVALVEGVVTLERDPRHFLDASDELDLPVDREARDARLDQLLWRRATALIESTSIRIQLPAKEVFQGENLLLRVFGARKKKLKVNKIGERNAHAKRRVKEKTCKVGAETLF